MKRPNSRLIIRRHRRPIAAALVGLAVLCILRGLQPDPPKTVSIVVASSDLPAGHTLAASDVVMRDWPVAFASGAAFGQSQLAVGRMTSGPLAAGEPVGPSRVVSPGLLELANGRGRQETGIVAAPVRLADPGEAALLKPGDRVDVLAASAVSNDPDPNKTDGGASAAARLIASSAQVIVVPNASESIKSGGLLGGGGSRSGSSPLDGGSMIVLAVDPATAAALAGAATRSRLSVVLRATTPTA